MAKLHVAKKKKDVHGPCALGLWCLTTCQIISLCHVADVKRMTITPPEYQISFHFTLRPAIFKSQTILRQMHCMNDPKMTLNTKVPHINIPTTSESPSFTLLRSIPGVFEIQAILRQVHQTTPKWNHR